MHQQQRKLDCPRIAVCTHSATNYRLLVQLPKSHLLVDSLCQVGTSNVAWNLRYFSSYMIQGQQRFLPSYCLGHLLAQPIYCVSKWVVVSSAAKNTHSATNYRLLVQLPTSCLLVNSLCQIGTSNVAWNLRYFPSYTIQGQQRFLPSYCLDHLLAQPIYCVSEWVVISCTFSILFHDHISHTISRNYQGTSSYIPFLPIHFLAFQKTLLQDNLWTGLWLSLLDCNAVLGEAK